MHVSLAIAGTGYAMVVDRRDDPQVARRTDDETLARDRRGGYSRVHPQLVAQPARNRKDKSSVWVVHRAEFILREVCGCVVGRNVGVIRVVEVFRLRIVVPVKEWV